MTKWQDKNVGYISKYKPGATKRKDVTNEIDGSVAGYHVEHHDGSQDAVVTPRTIQLTGKVTESW